MSLNSVSLIQAPYNAFQYAQQNAVFKIQTQHCDLLTLPDASYLNLCNPDAPFKSFGVEI